MTKRGRRTTVKRASPLEHPLTRRERLGKQYVLGEMRRIENFMVETFISDGLQVEKLELAGADMDDLPLSERYYYNYDFEALSSFIDLIAERGPCSTREWTTYRLFPCLVGLRLSYIRAVPTWDAIASLAVAQSILPDEHATEIIRHALADTRAEPLKRSARNRKQYAQRRHQQWKQWAAQIRQSHLHISSKRGIARIMKQKYGVDAAIGTIADVIE